MDYYPQPRPVLYGTRADEPPPRTQIAPVRTGPPRWPPAPPLADFAPEPGDDNWWHSRWILPIDRLRRPAALMLLSIVYALATAYTCLQVVLNPSGMAGLRVGLVALGIEFVLGLLVTLSLWWPYGEGYLIALCAAPLQILIGIVLGQWLWLFLWLAIVVCIYLLLPSMRLTFGAQALQTARCDIARWKRHHPPRHRGKPGNPPRNMPDHWREL